MNKLILITLLGFLMLGCSSENEEAPAAEPEAQAESGVKAFHPTDDTEWQGGKGETSDGSEAKLP